MFCKNLGKGQEYKIYSRYTKAKCQKRGIKMPNFTKKHYNRIAYILGISKNKKEIIEEMVAFFKNDNPNFDEKRFRDAIKIHENL